MFYERGEGERVGCYLCAHNCKITSGQFGFCGVRQNIQGSLNTLVYAEVIAANIDPIEKKPLYHFLPGSVSFSIATIGCNFSCGFCQNWQISQASKRSHPFRDRRSHPFRGRLSQKDKPKQSRELMPEAVVGEAKARRCESISYTYTEPTIFFEYAYDTAKLAKGAGLKNIFVTNGYMSPDALKTLSPYLDAANIDLKSFREEFYAKNCKGHLQPVLDSIKLAKELGIWIEVTTLIVPGQNDSSAELSDIAGFIASVGKDIPWHLSRFHPDYEFLNQKPTPIESLSRAEDLGKKAGLRYIYLGNTLQDCDTYCYNCRKLLVKRSYFDIIENNIVEGKCQWCGKVIDGVY